VLTGRPQSHPPTSQTLLGSAAECQGRRERGKQPARNHLRGRFGEACPRSESVLRAPQLLPASRTTDRELSRRNERGFLSFFGKKTHVSPHGCSRAADGGSEGVGQDAAGDAISTGSREQPHSFGCCGAGMAVGPWGLQFLALPLWGEAAPTTRAAAAAVTVRACSAAGAGFRATGTEESKTDAGPGGDASPDVGVQAASA